MDYTQFRLSTYDSDDRPVTTFEDYIEAIKHSVLETIKYKCLKEMYLRAQPSVDYDDLLKDHFKRISDGLKAESFYERYYLSHEECKYIVNKYIDSYHLNDDWDDTFDLLLKDVNRVISVDKYIPGEGDSPGHKGYEYKEPLNVLIEKILNPEFEVSKEEIDRLARSFSEKNPFKVSDIATKIFNLFNDFLKERKDFYQRNQLANAFSCQIYLGVSPNSSLERVEEYWKEHGLNLEIDPRHHDENYFWCEEHDYLDDDINEVVDED